MGPRSEMFPYLKGAFILGIIARDNKLIRVHDSGACIEIMAFLGEKDYQ